MHYNKKKVDHDLENGISDCADCIGDLFDFINSMFKNIDDSEKISEMKDKWEQE